MFYPVRQQVSEQGSQRNKNVLSCSQTGFSTLLLYFILLKYIFILLRTLLRNTWIQPMSFVFLKGVFSKEWCENYCSAKRWRHFLHNYSAPHLNTTYLKGDLGPICLQNTLLKPRFLLVLCRTSNRSMLARSRSEKCAFVLARSSKMSFFVRISVRYSEILAEHLMFI